MAAMREAASLENTRLRVGGIAAVLDQLETWHSRDGHPLSGQLDLNPVGMSGHSFDKRIKAAVIMSPGTPRGRLGPGSSFADVAIPVLLMAGTNDIAAIGSQTVESRLAVFPALPRGPAYEIVLHNAEHSAFTDRPLPGDQGSRNPNHHRVMLALTIGFWDAFLRNDAAARDWLDGSAPRSLLDEHDR
jgi:predicted dienelactone hydrolase